MLRPKSKRQQDKNQHVRQAVENIDDAHHQMIPIAAFEAGDQSIARAEQERDQGGAEPHR